MILVLLNVIPQTIVVKPIKLIMNNTTYCDLENLNQTFNNKPLFKCRYCGLTVGLEKADTKIMCFKKIEDIANKIHENHIQSTDTPKPFHIESGSGDIQAALLSKLKEKAQEDNEKSNGISDQEANICSSEQIDERLSICQTCEYFKDSSCLLCGCTIVREANHKNKLAHKDQKCPADKWGQILSDPIF